MEHVARVRRSEVHSVFGWKPQVMRPFSRTRRRKGHIKPIIEMDWGCWLIYMAQGRIQWQSFEHGNVLLLSYKMWAVSWLNDCHFLRKDTAPYSWYEISMCSVFCMGERVLLQWLSIHLGVMAETCYLWDVFKKISSRMALVVLQVGFCLYSTSCDML